MSQEQHELREYYNQLNEWFIESLQELQASNAPAIVDATSTLTHLYDKFRDIGKEIDQLYQLGYLQNHINVKLIECQFEQLVEKIESITTRINPLQQDIVDETVALGNTMGLMQIESSGV